jgi:hypothetical protein
MRCWSPHRWVEINKFGEAFDNGVMFAEAGAGWYAHALRQVEECWHESQRYRKEARENHVPRFAGDDIGRNDPQMREK